MEKSFRAQTMMKARLAGAHKGHGLLKKKADALQMRFRLILGKIIEVSKNLHSLNFQQQQKLHFFTDKTTHG